MGTGTPAYLGMTPHKIAITGAMGPAGRALLEQCRKRGIAQQVLALDMLPTHLWPNFEVVEAAADSQYLPHLVQIINEHHITLLIPTVSEELTLLAYARTDGLVPSWCQIAVDSPSATRWAHDKYLTMKKLAACAVTTPDFGLPSNFPDALAVFAQWNPQAVVVKPRIARGGRGVEVFDTPHQLQQRWAYLDNSWLLQSFASGVEYSPMVHTSYARATSSSATENSSRPLVVVVEKTVLAQGRVGNAVETKIVDTPDVARLAIQATQALGLQQPADLDIRRDHSGIPQVLEVNARFGANSGRAPQIFAALLASVAATQPGVLA